MSLYPFFTAAILTSIEIIKLIISGILPIIALYLLIRYGNLIQSSEAGKSRALGDVSFLYEAQSKVFHSGNKIAIELEIKITNQSSKKLGILSLFVKYKPLLNDTNEVLNYESFDKLDDFEGTISDGKEVSLSILKNIVYLKNSLWQTSVNGVTVRRRIDLISKETAKKYPLLIVQIIIHGSSMDLIDKTHFPNYHIGRLRSSWISFMESKMAEKYDFFSRVGPEGYISDKLTLKHGERIIVHKDGSIDDDNTKLFKPLIDSIVSSSIEKVIKLDD